MQTPIPVELLNGIVSMLETYRPGITAKDIEDIKPNSKEPADEWLKVSEAAAYVNLSEQTIRMKIKKHEIKAAHVGGSVRISKNSLQDFIKPI